MANGKGTIECCYCKHFAGQQGYPAGHGATGHCAFHDKPLPNAEHLNRICCHFEPNEFYWRDNAFWMPPARRFGWFAQDLKPGVLYFFSYNAPQKIEREVVLREPDYQANQWKPG
jgi:hypothetical protein